MTTRNPTPAPRVVRPIGRAGHAAASQPPRDARDECNDDDNVSPRFMAATAGIALAVFAGIWFLFLDDRSANTAKALPDGFQSVVDATCGGTWEKGKSNVDELNCYLTTSVERLCDKRERKHLIATIGRFEKDYASFSARHFAASLGSIAKVQVNSASIGIESRRLQKVMDDPNATAEQQAEALARMTELMGGIMSGPDAVRAEKHNKTPFYQLEDDLKRLILDGYVAEKDFGRSHAHWVKRAFKIDRLPAQPCSG